VVVLCKRNPSVFEISDRIANDRDSVLSENTAGRAAMGWGNQRDWPVIEKSFMEIEGGLDLPLNHLIRHPITLDVREGVRTEFVLGFTFAHHLGEVACEKQRRRVRVATRVYVEPGRRVGSIMVTTALREQEMADYVERYRDFERFAQ
jgi:hypothetical protein